MTVLFGSDEAQVIVKADKEILKRFEMKAKNVDEIDKLLDDRKDLHYEIEGYQDKLSFAEDRLTGIENSLRKLGWDDAR